jgi:hypothetical protein
VEGLTLAERKAVTKQLVTRYHRATKKQKGAILDELCALTGWNRDHARKALRRAALPTTPRRVGEQPRTFGPEVLEPLRQIWAILDAPAGKRLAPFMTEILDALERHREIELEPEVRDRLLRISAAMIDRLLARIAVATHPIRSAPFVSRVRFKRPG